jgi:hypothetical protein
MSEYLTNLRNHIDAVKGKPFEEKMRRAEMFEELYEYAKRLELYDYSKFDITMTTEIKTN